MTVLSQQNAQTLYNQAGPDLFAAFALRNIGNGDTLDISTLDIMPKFQVIRKAVIFSDGGAQLAIANVVGTVVTIPQAIPATSSGYLVITGC